MVVVRIIKVAETIIAPTMNRVADIIHGIHGMTHIRMFGILQLLLAIIVITPLKIITQAGKPQMNEKRKVVVAVSGGFDPLHRGHILYLRAAKQLGDYLVDLLNSDEFLSRKKGKPFMGFEERKEILEYIRYVDEVVRVIDKDEDRKSVV